MATPPQRANVKSELALKKNVVRLPENHVIFREGDTSTDVYLMLNGSVSVIKRQEDGEEGEIAVIVEPMSYFGEMSALLNEPRSATIKTKTPCEFVVLPGNKLDSIVDVSPQVGKKLLSTLAKRLAEANKQAVAANNQVKLVKAKFSNEYSTAIKDYKRLVQMLNLTFNECKLPQVMELFKFAQNNSILAKMGIKTTLTADHVREYNYLSKVFSKTNGVV